ncbi:alpha/beta fold hydrolase [Salsipaludibacter albus]|uniref:alpha/beta fold hydrolase n=1 Tax=Salsipaludibacter albus TaxID=2849650 RepID=UPI001EE42A03|nr:alpha/beta hydrolase [Salsipaludibacter albus]
MDRPTPALEGIRTSFTDVEGVAIHAAEVGSAVDGDTGVLLLHHFYGNVATWRRVLQGLGDRGVHAIAVDRPGFGWTERPAPGRRPEVYTRRFAAEAARAVAAERGMDRVLVVGSSMGGTLALETTIARPDGVDGLVLLSPALTGDVGMPPPLRPLLRTAPVRRAVRPLVDRLSRDIDLQRVAGGWVDSSTAGPDDVAAYRDPTRLPGWAAGIWAVMTVEEPPRLNGRLGAIDVPVTVVAGTHDRTIRPRWNQRTAAALDADLVEVPTGHTPQEEAPDTVVDVVAGRLGDGQGQRSTPAATADGIRARSRPDP